MLIQFGNLFFHFSVEDNRRVTKVDVVGNVKEVYKKCGRSDRQ